MYILNKSVYVESRSKSYMFYQKRFPLEVNRLTK